MIPGSPLPRRQTDRHKYFSSSLRSPLAISRAGTPERSRVRPPATELLTHASPMSLSSTLSMGCPVWLPLSEAVERRIPARPRAEIERSTNHKPSRHPGHATNPYRVNARDFYGQPCCLHKGGPRIPASSVSVTGNGRRLPPMLTMPFLRGHGRGSAIR